MSRLASQLIAIAGMKVADAKIAGVRGRDVETGVGEVEDHSQ